MSMRKYEILKESLRKMGPLAVAFSGGADSALLLYAAREALGEHVLAMTAVAEAFPENESAEAEEFCRKYGIRQVIVPFQALGVKEFRDNPPDRCYYCKKALFRLFLDTASKAGIGTVAEGSNLDDESDIRPGHRAIAELSIRSPLREAELTKAEIRAISKELGLPTWDKPSRACLASRVPYGEEITSEKLTRIGQAEQYLLDLGFTQVRVRSHENTARIELLPEEMGRLLNEEVRTELVRRFKALGFLYVSLDLQGFRSGSMNEVL